ncbi:MAG: flagellar protein FlaG [Firmicutes bacterium]|nr:flagellar protein FlaG [Bacillota bacterium]
MRVEAVDRRVMVDGNQGGMSAAGTMGRPGKQGAAEPKMGAEGKGFALEDVRQATEALDKTVKALNSRLSFVFHEDSGRMQVQVVDNQTQEVVKEIPPTEVLEVVAHIREMIGVLLDKKA